MVRRTLLSSIAAFFVGLGGKGSTAAAARVAAPAGAGVAGEVGDTAAFPYPVITVAGRDALAARRRLKAEGRGWPVIVGDDESLAGLAETLTFDERSPEAILEAAAGLRMPESLIARKSADNEAWSKQHPEFADVEDDEGPDEGAWPSEGDTPEPPGEIPGTPIGITDYRTGDYIPRAHIVLLPTLEGAAAPAFLRYGSWNDCPPPEYHVAQLRLLHDRYGFELISIGRDTVEGQFERLPKTRAEALDLARALHVYCSDSIYPGFDTVSAYAHNLLTSRWRFFWWD